MRICFVASEVAPLAKTGGLADVSAGLGRYLAGEGHDVRVFLPCYRRIREAGWRLEPVAELQDIPLRFGRRTYHVSISTTRPAEGGLDLYLVRCPELFDRDELYGPSADEHMRFATLSRAAIECCQWMQWSPDVFHCNDWHTAVVPLYLKHAYAWDRLFRRTKSVLTIHNIDFQGVFGTDVLADLGWEDSRDLFWREDLARGQVIFMRTGLLYADAVTTVSETYAREIQTPEAGRGLDPLLRERARTLFGIVNGVDYGTWNPEIDPAIARRYSAATLAGKAHNRVALLEERGLDQDPTGPVMGIVSRLTDQKGFELFGGFMHDVLGRTDSRLVVLGSGEQRLEDYFRSLAASFPSRASFHCGYDEALAHRIEAGSDLFLMPSRYEPCGLNQMYSLKYGTPPLVRKTGGLADTVQPFDPATGRGTGFVFEEYRSEAFFAALQRALRVFRDRTAWERLMRNGMAEDWSWERQGARYVELYEWLRGQGAG